MNSSLHRKSLRKAQSLCANSLGGSYKTAENFFQGFQKECFTAIGSPNQHELVVFTPPLDLCRFNSSSEQIYINVVFKKSILSLC